MHTTSQPYEWRKRMRKINNNKKGWLHHKSQPVSIDTLKLAPSCLGVYWSKKKKFAPDSRVNRQVQTYILGRNLVVFGVFSIYLFFFFFFVGKKWWGDSGFYFLILCVGFFCGCFFFFFWRFLFFKPLDLALLLHRLKNFLNNYHGR